MSRARRDVGKTKSRRLAKLETILKLAYQVRRGQRFGRILRGGAREVLLDALIEYDPSFMERYIESNEELARANQTKRMILLDPKRLVSSYRRKYPLVESLASRETGWDIDSSSNRSWRDAIAVYYTKNGNW